MKALKNERNDKLERDDQDMQSIIAHHQMQSIPIRPEVRATYLIGYKMRQVFNTQQAFSPVTIQSIARSLHEILDMSSLFPDPKKISYYDIADNEVHTHDLVSSKDVQAYLYSNNLIKSPQKYLNEYFARTSPVRYVPHHFYICKSTDDYQLRFQQPDMTALINCYHKIVTMIERHLSQDSCSTVLIEDDHWYDDFKADRYVIDMIVRHHKAGLYRIHADDMKDISQVGSQIDYLITHYRMEELTDLDKIADNLVKLTERGVFSTYHISNLLDRTAVVREKSAMLAYYEIDRIDDNPDCWHYFGQIRDIKQKYVQCDEGRLNVLNARALGKDYHQIIKEIMAPNPMIKR